VSVKREAHGAAGAYIDTQVRVGDVLDASAPRGSFTLRPGDGPVILLSAGIGATPVLAMLHALVSGALPREIWRIYGARSGGEHPFAAEVRALLKVLPRSRSHIRYSSPDRADRPAVDFDAAGRLRVRVLEELGVPRDADFYLCGPTAFMSDLAADLAGWGGAADRLHTENFGSGPSKTPGVAAAPRRPPHSPDGLLAQGRWYLSREAASMYAGI
jgi:ferredoxin-NADP reductase